MMGVGIPPLPQTEWSPHTLCAQAREGLSFIYHRDGLRNFIVLMGIVGLFMRGMSITLASIGGLNKKGKSMICSLIVGGVT
jgi:hypothetical protein